MLFLINLLRALIVLIRMLCMILYDFGIYMILKSAQYVELQITKKLLSICVAIGSLKKEV